MKPDDFDYALPPALIAQYPPAKRGDSRLLILDGPCARDGRFADLPALLAPGDCLVFNDTRVIPARLLGRKASGGRIEMLIERVLDGRRALAHIHASKAPRPGGMLEFGDGLHCRVLAKSEDGLYEVESSGALALTELLARVGHLPLPPYIARGDEPLDAERYQTVYARTPGAVAAPTAGLHFDLAMLDRLRAAGVQLGYLTLHVGAGTFQPVRTENLAAHRMHSEFLDVPAALCELVAGVKAAGKRVIAVGTTAVRALETAAAAGTLAPWQGDTRLFIVPGYRFKVVDALITNFHLPRSTLLMLVAAFAGHARTLAAYRHAVAAGYRFFSYGDAMFVTPDPAERDAAMEQA
ncbi:MAG TPA: tRNA preQ1(34) S-adenosylmethionine ribosyltransferase-isomerase QueA [Gammaproteobacteria bacterium]|nr:tRNA preQ1(34) S-adenosylmethionine ribosyltransferase-isomerase QueA [Gammaproteobacteria bacterium]